MLVGARVRGRRRRSRRACRATRSRPSAAGRWPGPRRARSRPGWPGPRRATGSSRPRRVPAGPPPAPTRTVRQRIGLGTCAGLAGLTVTGAVRRVAEDTALSGQTTRALVPEVPWSMASTVTLEHSSRNNFQHNKIRNTRRRRPHARCQCRRRIKHTIQHSPDAEGTVMAICAHGVKHCGAMSSRRRTY